IAQLVSGLFSSTWEVHDLPDGKLRTTLRALPDSDGRLVLASDNRTLASTGALDGEITLTDIHKDRRLHSWTLDVANIKPAFSPDGQMLAAVCGKDKAWALKMWDPRS